MAIINKDEFDAGKPVIDLTGPAGNAFAVMGAAQGYRKQLNYYTNEDGEFTLLPSIDDILSEMQSGDYENLIAVFDKYFGEYVILLR